MSKWSIKGTCAVGDDEIPAWDDETNSAIECFAGFKPNITSASESSSLDWQLSLAVWSVVSFCIKLNRYKYIKKSLFNYRYIL